MIHNSKKKKNIINQKVIAMLKALVDYYYFVLIPLFSIAVFYGLQYLTRGMHYFVDEDNNIKWRYLLFMAVMQFFISVLITWSVVSAFSSQYLSQYESIKMTAIIIIGSAPFNITILIWVALKLEAYKLMRKRYGDNFHEDEFFYETQKVKEKENRSNFKITQNMLKDSNNPTPNIKPVDSKVTESKDETKKEQT